MSFMQRYSFGTIVTNVNGTPVATHLPFHIRQEEANIFITAHMAKANKHWQAITEQENLVIFSEPHAYISPSHYESEQSVPTWNYLAVHAYGKARIINDTPAVIAVLENSIKDYEPAYMQQWNGLPESYKLKMINGIVAFDILVTDLQAVNKLSQNKQEAERKRIIDTLSQSEDTTAREIGEYMKATSTPPAGIK